MTPQARFQLVEELFHAALERGSEALDTVDPELRREVEALLASYREWSAALPRPVEAPMPRFGPYQCDSILGSGGMGTVYRARRDDGQFTQEVAIKVLRGSLRSEWFRRRFLAEREILARLNHPSIARLLDGGMTAEGEPYLVMELVEGEPIDQFCDRQNVSISRRLSLFVQALEAVDYAHRNLVVHRDLKPGNLLVTGEGQPKLLDFGTSKLVEGDDLTTVTKALTPRYASPEQLRGEPAGIVSDVFSAGVMLYEILTGAHPFGEAVIPPQSLLSADLIPVDPATQLSDAAARSRGTTVPALRKMLAGDLGSILRKAVAGSQSERYATISALREDLENFQRGLPVRARKITFLYRARKFVRRHRLGVAAAAAVTLAVLGAAVYSQHQSSLARTEARRAKAVSDFVEGMFTAIDVWRGGRADIRVVDVIDRASRDASTKFPADPTVESQIRLTLGTTYSSLERPDHAVAEFQRGLELARAVQDRPLEILHQVRLAGALTYTKHPEHAEAEFQKALTAVDKLPAPNRYLEYYVTCRLAEFVQPHRPEEAIRLYLRGIEAAKNARDVSEAALAGTMARLATVYTELNQRERAWVWANESLRRFRNMKKMPLEGYAALDVTAALLVPTGKQAEIVRLRREALDLDIRDLGYSNPSTIIALAKWARSSVNLGKLDEVLPEMEHGIAELQKAYPQCVLPYWNPIESYSEFLGKAGRFVEAEKYARQALACLTPEVTGTTYESQTLFALGRALRGQGRTDEARATLRRSYDLYEKLRGKDHQTTATVRLELEKLDRKNARP